MITQRMRIALPIVVILAGAFPAGVLAQINFNTSLHSTRFGKEFWYSADNGGFENLTHIPISELGCRECHGPNDANGTPNPDPYPGMHCNDCHKTNSDFSVEQTQCYTCHGRQATEAMKLGLSDVHRDAGMVCWDCHSSNDMHGDGTEYVSMLEDGAIDADCENCHGTAERPMPAGHGTYDPHGGKLACAACHAQTVISCYNCHFESVVEHHMKRAKQPLHGFVMLANRLKDGKVFPMSFQSATFEGKAFVAFGPYAPHTITAQGRSCPECHNNMGGSVAAINEYNATGKIQFATWDDTNKVLTNLQGIIPIPADYETSLKMDFITYDGDTADPVVPSDNWSSIGKDTWDLHQMFFASPLTPEQMEKLGFEAPNAPPIVDPGGPYSGVAGQPVQFDASGTVDPDGDDLVFMWTFEGDPTPAFGAQVSHTWDTAGTYTATVTVTDGNNDPVSEDVSVEITDGPPPAEGDTWIVKSPFDLLDEGFTINFEPFAGILITQATYADGYTANGIGMEFDGVIYWMDSTFAIYFGNINRAAGTMSGISFNSANTTIWFGEPAP